MSSVLVDLAGIEQIYLTLVHMPTTNRRHGPTGYVRIELQKAEAPQSCTYIRHWERIKRRGSNQPEEFFLIFFV